MPSLAQVWSEIEPVLPGRTGRSSPPGGGGFAELLRVHLETAVDPRKAAIAVEALGEHGFERPGDLAGADFRELEEVFKTAKVAIKPATIKTLQRLAAWIEGRGGEIEPLRGIPPDVLRDELRSIPGVGSTTADAILLFGLGLPAYPVDRATYRILARHGWIDPACDYDDARDAMTSAVGPAAAGLADASLAFDRIGRDFCKTGEPKCERCPLRPWLPEGGPIQG